MYRIQYDRAVGLIRVIVEGFWDVSTVHAYQAELLPIMELARAERGSVLILSDARNFPVQSAEVAAEFARTPRESDPMWDRLATVMKSTLGKMQGARALAGSGARFFTSMEEAEAWLLTSII